MHETETLDLLVDQKQRERMRRGAPDSITHWWSSWVRNRLPSHSFCSLWQPRTTIARV